MRLKRNERLVYVLEAAIAAVSLLFTLFLFHLPLGIKAYCLVVALGVILMAALFMFGYHRDKHYLRPFLCYCVSYLRYLLLMKRLCQFDEFERLILLAGNVKITYIVDTQQFVPPVVFAEDGKHLILCHGVL
jgi:hypothetical protein